MEEEENDRDATEFEVLCTERQMLTKMDSNLDFDDVLKWVDNPG